MRVYHKKRVCAHAAFAFVLGVFPLACDNSGAQLVTMTGPDHHADVQLADADIWIVPPLDSSGVDTPEQVTWALVHPNAPTRALIRRTCTHIHESFLWLSDPPNWTESSTIATLHACGTPGEFYSTVELAYDGVQWIGVSATGAATLLPPQ